MSLYMKNVSRLLADQFFVHIVNFGSFTTIENGTKNLPVSNVGGFCVIRLIILSTGATGYIGGDTLFALYEKHPDYEYAALIRSGKKFLVYPSMQ